MDDNRIDGTEKCLDEVDNLPEDIIDGAADEIEYAEADWTEAHNADDTDDSDDEDDYSEDSDWEDDDDFVPNFADPIKEAKKREEVKKRKSVGVRMNDGTIVIKDDLPPLEDLTEEQREKRKKFQKRVLMFFLALTICQLGWMGLRINYHADKASLAAVEYGEIVGKGIVFMPDGDIKAGIVLYPGGQIEYTSYAALAKELCDEGYLVVISKMTMNMALLSPKNGEVYLNMYKDLTDNWYIGGHSIGGVASAQYAAKSPEKVDGVILLASYSSNDISKLGLPVLTIYGTKDLVLDEVRRGKYEKNLPIDAVVVKIEGGNHSGFGNHGQQDGDGLSDISQTEQRAQIVEAIAAFITK